MVKTCALAGSPGYQSSALRNEIHFFLPLRRRNEKAINVNFFKSRQKAICCTLFQISISTLLDIVSWYYLNFFFVSWTVERGDEREKIMLEFQDHVLSFFPPPFSLSTSVPASAVETLEASRKKKDEKSYHPLQISHKYRALDSTVVFFCLLFPPFSSSFSLSAPFFKFFYTVIVVDISLPLLLNLWRPEAYTQRGRATEWNCWFFICERAALKVSSIALLCALVSASKIIECSFRRDMTQIYDSLEPSTEPSHSKIKISWLWFHFGMTSFHSKYAQICLKLARELTQQSSARLELSVELIRLLAFISLFLLSLIVMWWNYCKGTCMTCLWLSRAVQTIAFSLENYNARGGASRQVKARELWEISNFDNFVTFSLQYTSLSAIVNISAECARERVKPAVQLCVVESNLCNIIRFHKHQSFDSYTKCHFTYISCKLNTLGERNFVDKEIRKKNFPWLVSRKNKCRLSTTLKNCQVTLERETAIFVHWIFYAESLETSSSSQLLLLVESPFCKNLNSLELTCTHRESETRAWAHLVSLQTVIFHIPSQQSSHVRDQQRGAINRKA